jgi:hypothetical protein
LRNGAEGDDAVLAGAHERGGGTVHTADRPSGAADLNLIEVPRFGRDDLDLAHELAAGLGWLGALAEPADLDPLFYRRLSRNR